MSDKKWWLSWYTTDAMGAWELRGPWWISGARLMRDGAEHPTVCAAVIAPDEDAAKQIIVESYDTPPADVEWRFCNERDVGWSPFCDRFPRARWMQWPDAEDDNAEGVVTADARPSNERPEGA